MRFSIFAAPGSDPEAARTRASALIAVDGPSDVAAAAHRCDDPYVLLLAAGARPLAGAFTGLGGASDFGVGVLGGATHTGETRAFGWMLAHSAGPLRFELSPVTAQLGEAGIDAVVRGPIDVVAPGMILAGRDLLLEPLPVEPVAALVELCARARAAGRAVVCRPNFACEAPPLDADDRGRAAALRALAARHPELVGKHRLPPAARRVTIDRWTRLEGGQRVRTRVPRPPVAILVHGPGAEFAVRRARELAPNATARPVDDAVAALRAELRVRGDRYVLVTDDAHFPTPEELDLLVERIEDESFVALAAPDAAALGGGCVLLHAGRFPQHVVPRGATLAAAIGSLVGAAHVLRRAVRAPGYLPPPQLPRSAAPRPRATIVFMASSLPEVSRLSLDALLAASGPSDEIVAVCAANAMTAKRILCAYPQLRIETDAADPLLTGGANRAIGASTSALIVLVADDVLVPPGALERMRDAFARVPTLGAAFPAVPGAAGGEGVTDVTYTDVAEMRALSERRERSRARELEPIDLAVTPALVVARAAFEAVGGIDPAFGPTRRGIAQLVTRLRAAGYAVVRCDDALVHRFDASFSQNPAAAAAAQQAVPPPPDPKLLAAGFDPALRVPFAVAPSAACTVTASHAIAIAVGGAAELEHAATLLAAAASAFDASSPVRVHVLLDGTAGAADVAARIRPILAASGKPMDATVTVRVERADDLRAWRAALEAGVRLVVGAGHERAAFAGLTSITSRELRGLLRPVAG